MYEISAIVDGRNSYCRPPLHVWLYYTLYPLSMMDPPNGPGAFPECGRRLLDAEPCDHPEANDLGLAVREAVEEPDGCFGAEPCDFLDGGVVAGRPVRPVPPGGPP